jgi:hypothetical protein
MNPVIDAAVADIRSKLEHQCYSLLSTHMKDYEGDAEDYTDRYGEINTANCKDDYAIRALSQFPTRPNWWIIHYNSVVHGGWGYEKRTYTLVDNYGATYDANVYIRVDGMMPTDKPIQLPTDNELLLMPRFNKTLIDCVKRAIPTEGGSWSDQSSRGMGVVFNGSGIMMPESIKKLCKELQNISRYHASLYGKINTLKQQLALQTRSVHPDYMDDLLKLA